MLVLIPGCEAKPAEPAPPPAAQTQSDVPPPLVPAMPLPDNAVDNAVAKLDGMVDDLMKKSGIPGMAVAVVHGGKTVYAKGFGVKDVRSGDKIDPDTVFQLASLSKPLSATVVAHQVGQSAIGWDTPIVSKLPWFALSDPVVTRMVSVGDMFSHRSGLPDHAGDMLEDLGYDRRYVLERLRQLPLDPFRISYAYTNFGLTAGAEAVAVSAGKPWEDLADEVLFHPLGMASTSFRFADYQARPDRAVGHIHVDGRYEPLYVRDPDPEAPAGGASSSVNDMTRWLTMMLANGSLEGKQIVDPKALLPAVTPQIVSSRATEAAMRSGFYGYGFNVGPTSAARMELSHSGAFELGSGTNFVILPSADVAIVALTNATPSGVPESLTAAVRRPRPVRRGARGLVQALWRRLQADGAADGLAGRAEAACQPRARRAAGVLRRHLQQRLLGSRAGHREGRQAAARPRRETGCAPGPLGRQHLHVLVGHPKTRRRERFPRPRSTATS